MLRAVFWDHDATLVDSFGLHWQKYVTVLAEFGVTVRPEWKPQVRHMNTITFGRWLQDEQKFVFPFDDYLKKADSWYAAHIDQIKPRQGIRPVLDILKKQNILMAVVSNGRPSSVTGALKATELFDYFSFIITADDVTNKKPHPEPYLTAFARMKEIIGSDLTPAETLVVEDDPKGVDAGAGAGLPVLQRPFSDDQAISPKAADSARSDAEFLEKIRDLLAK